VTPARTSAGAIGRRRSESTREGGVMDT